MGDLVTRRDLMGELPILVGGSSACSTLCLGLRVRLTAVMHGMPLRGGGTNPGPGPTRLGGTFPRWSGILSGLLFLPLFHLYTLFSFSYFH